MKTYLYLRETVIRAYNDDSGHAGHVSLLRALFLALMAALGGGGLVLATHR
jgi:hypothetical protein